MPAPSVRSKIAGVGSIRDFASKRKRPIAVCAATLALMAVSFGLVLSPWGEQHKGALEDVGKAWACTDPPDLPHPGDIEADTEAAKKLKDQYDSCKKAVERAKNLAAKYHLSEKETAELQAFAEHHPQATLRVLAVAEHHPQAALRVLAVAEHDPQIGLKVLGFLARHAG